MTGGPFKPIPPSTWRLATQGMELAGAVAGGCLLGYWIDRHFGTAPWALVIGASVGIIGGLYNLIRKAVHESLRMASRKDRRARPPGAEGRDDDRSPPKAGGA
ncbi:MAG TPA: AtpZ/AtpI family protein [Phycisphaerae bacterium]|nr:AtpZ/AtpI family protein [Phycisphaerae bacterium]HPP27422.1 AtpZ/AtpI family protein [Phycisphaerae bacterium]HPU25690.1 AtpZ/AtpI family protein [Phycisphaerae bacterium]HQE27128.1 AtpZ/AtpI family protein [Phycisphaerae bacterium]